MIRTARGTDPAIVLVVDDHTAKILSSCLRMYDIMEAGVLVLQNISKKREKLPDLPAVSACTDSGRWRTATSCVAVS
jgi:hypothetical protein